MALPTVIASNQTAGAILLTRLGLTVPASGTLNLTDYAKVSEIKEDESLESNISTGNLLLNYGEGDLTQGDSLKFFDLVPLEVRISVRALSDANIASLSGTTTIDTVSLAVNDRVLLTGQTTGSENGVWVVKAGAWVRPQDFEVGRSAAAAEIFIQEGATYAGQLWACTTVTGSDVIGTNSLSFAQISGGAGGVTNLQEAYEGGNTINVTAAEGDLAFTLTSADFTVDGANDFLIGTTTPLDEFNVDARAFSIDSTDTSNLTLSANDAANKTLTISATNAGAGDGLLSISSDGTTDIDAGGALSLNSSGGAINVGDDAVSQPINIGTGAAARTITIGNATGATQLDLNSGTGGTLVDSTGPISLDGVGNSNFTTDTGDLSLSTSTSGDVLVSSAGAVDVQASGNVTIDSSAGSLNMGSDANTGNINIGTGAAARIITIGNSTGATALNLTSGTGNTLITSPQVTMTGDLVVQGTTTTVHSEIVNVADSFLYLNDGYTTTTALEGGIVVNSLPTATTDTVAVGGFTAGVPATSNPTVATTGAATFSAGDFIQISGANDQTNDGLFEVLSHVGNVLTIAGVGTTGATYQFTQNQFDTDSTVAGAITKVNIGVVQVDTAGDLQYGYGSDTTLTLENVLTSSDLTLQGAYEGGNTITTSAAEGVVTIAGDQKLQITATNGLDVDTVFDFDGTSFDVQMTGNNGFSLDGTASSNVTATNTAAGVPVTMTLSATNTGTGASNSTLSLSATSTNGTGNIDMDADDAVSIDVGAAGTIDIGTAAAVSTTTIGNNTGTTGVNIDSGSEMVEIDGVTYYGEGAGAPTATGSGFQDGDKYYDTDLDMEMRYDATRAKWLSVEAMYIQFGRNFNTPAGVYYRGINGLVMSSTTGLHMPYDGTIVGLGYTRDDSDAATFDVVEDGTSRATLASSATTGRSNTLDGDFSQGGILAVRNAAGSNTTSDVMGWVKVRFRSV